MPESKNVRALLLDMGGVLLRLHPRRVFEYWAEASDASPQSIASQWAIDDAYREFETGQIPFTVYTQHLSARLGIKMALENWRLGWIALIGSPYDDVFEIVHEAADVMPIYCFTNSNVEHENVYLNRYGAELHVLRHIFNSYTLGCRKPDIPAFQYVAQLIGLKPEEIAFFDDNAANVDGASITGMVAHRTTHPAQTVKLISNFLHFKDI